MSFVIDQVRLVDAQLDQFHLTTLDAVLSSPLLSSEPTHDIGFDGDGADEARVIQLRNAIKSLSTASSTRVQLQAAQIESSLQQAWLLGPRSDDVPHGEEHQKTSLEQELEWLLVSKAAVQTYGLILNVLLEQTIPLSRDIWYWDEVLGSYPMLGLYSVQTSPLRLWRWANDVYHDARQKLQSIRIMRQASLQENLSLSDRWTRFYSLVKDSIRERSIGNMQSQMMSSLIMCRAEVRRKQSYLRRLREMSATGLGVLLDEGLTFEVNDDAFKVKGNCTSANEEEWKSVVSKSVALVETVIRNITVLELGPSEFEDTVFMGVDDDTNIVQNQASEGQLSKPVELASRIQQILFSHLPFHMAASDKIVAENGRPSYVIRYWIPAALLVFSSSTLLRIFVKRKEEILEWIRNFGATMVDFWYNWIVEPLKKIVGTIRHDENSEVAIMNKGSLEGDKASLERMVIDFAMDNPSNGVALSDADIADVRARIKEGDLTPVLKAYEKDLRRPIVGTIKGDLIRALLIQVQKTKVDIEIAVGGIDALLKSQELVFGFVGLTPGLLVCAGIFHWLSTLSKSRMREKENLKPGQTLRNLRNIDRVLSASRSSTSGMLSYKDHGLLLCEVHVLRQSAQRLLPAEINADFLEELSDLVDIRTGIERQLRVVDRIRWAYRKWLPI